LLASSGALVHAPNAALPDRLCGPLAAQERSLIRPAVFIDGRSAQVQTTSHPDRQRADPGRRPLAQVQAGANARVIDLSQMTVLPASSIRTRTCAPGDVTSEEYEDQLLKQSIRIAPSRRAQRAHALDTVHGDPAIGD